MSTLGNTGTPTFGYDAYNSTANQAGQSYTVPSPGGIFTSVSFYGSGDGGTVVKAYGCIWDNSGNLLAAGAGINTSGGSQAGAGQAWHTDTFASPIFIPAGTSIYIGWWRQASTGTFDWSFASDGLAVHYHTDALTSPGHTGTAITVQNGSIGAYATYTPAGAYVRRAGSWNAGPDYRSNGTTWNASVGTFRRSGATWNPGG